jgi:hypothetical protein
MVLDLFKRLIYRINGDASLSPDPLGFFIDLASLLRRPRRDAMADIFLSYAKEDREIARGLSRLFIRAGWTVWWDRRIPAGLTWRRILESALRDMRCMVVLWSSHSIESDWVKEEAEEARLRKKLVPVLIETVIPPVGFRTVQAADLTDWDGTGESRGARQLIADLELILGKPAARAGIAAKPRAAAGQRPDQTRTEISVTGVEPTRGKPGTQSDRGSSTQDLPRWKLAGGLGIGLVLAFGLFTLWRDRAPVTDEVAKAVATTPTRSSTRIPAAPKLVDVVVQGLRQELKPDETLALSARGRFSDGTETEIAGAVKWSSSNARVAKVDGAGRLTALQSGTTQITATHGGVTSSAWSLAVKPLPPTNAPAPALVALTVNAYKRELEPRERMPLSVIGKYSDGSEKTLSAGWVLTSDNAAVLAVTATGEVEAWQAGNAGVVARSGNVTSAPLRFIVREPQSKVAVQPRQRKRAEYVPGKTSTDAVVTPAPDARSTAPELSGERPRANIAPYISRAKSFRAQGNYRAAIAELATARAVDPASQEVGAEIEQTKRACIAERKLGNRGLDCSL